MRIISLSPAITEILFVLNAGNQIVANTYLCDYPEAAKKITKVGSFTNIDYVKLKSLLPDLIITSTIVQQRIYETLKTKGFRVVHIDPRSLSDILNSLKLLAKLINKQQIATKIVRVIQKEINQLKYNQLPRKPRVYIEEWYDPPMYSGNWVPDLVELAGGEYFSQKKGGISLATPEQKLLEFDPECIFVSYCGFGKNSDINKILNRKNWQKISAIKNKQVFAINETVLNRPGPRILQSAKEIYDYLRNV